MSVKTYDRNECKFCTEFIEDCGREDAQGLCVTTYLKTFAYHRGCKVINRKEGNQKDTLE